MNMVLGMPYHTDPKGAVKFPLRRLALILSLGATSACRPESCPDLSGAQAPSTTALSPADSALAIRLAILALGGPDTSVVHAVASFVVTDSAFVAHVYPAPVAEYARVGGGGSVLVFRNGMTRVLERDQ